MTLEALDVAIGTGPDAPLPPTTLTVPDGLVSVARVETAERPVLLALVLTGRMTPDAGRVLIDRSADREAIRRATAIVDVPGVDEPHPELKLRTVVAEQLALASRPSASHAVARVLDDAGLSSAASTKVRLLDPADRIRLLAGLAAARPGIRTLVVTSPQRHGGDAASWLPALTRIADRGHGVAVLTDATAFDDLLTLGAHDAGEPLPEAS